MKKLTRSVYPSKEQTVSVEHDEKYQGAHKYKFQNCAGFDQEKQQHIYLDNYQEIQFVKIEADGSITPGLQNEQVLIAMIDRLEKISKEFPSDENKKIIAALKEALGQMEQRVHNRMVNGKIGKLVK